MRTHYNDFVHPNMEKEDDEPEEEKKSCLTIFNDFDDNFIRPYLIYKYDRIKGRPQYEVADMLEEYKMIEEELNNQVEADTGDGGGDISYAGKSISFAMGDVSGRGLLAQYIGSRNQGQESNGNGDKSLNVLALRNKKSNLAEKSISLRQGAKKSNTLKLASADE